MKLDVGLETMQRAFHIHYGRRRRILGVVLAVLAAVVFILGFYVHRLGYAIEGWMGMIVGVIVGLALVLAPVVFRQRLESQFKQMRDDPAAMEMVFTDEHLEIKTESSDGRIQWVSFVKWREADGLVLAYRHNAYFNVIPVDQLPEADAARVRRYLTDACGPSR
ncbi:MAG: YcxB family protein [Phycisphaerae bacterium]|nr:YcxB family protein [Phycisphaerae bacterium]